MKTFWGGASIWGHFRVLPPRIREVGLEAPVPRLERLINPDGTALSQACGRREGQVKGLHARYNVLKGGEELPYRKILADARARDVGRQLGEAREGRKTKIKEGEARIHRIQDRARKLGLSMRDLNYGPEADEGTKLMLEAEREHEQMLAAQREQTGVGTEETI